jgi:large-conductance mechanosensitive channel
MEQPRIILFITNNNTLMTTLTINDIILKSIETINNIFLKLEYNILLQYFIDFMIIISCLIIFIVLLDKLMTMADNYVKKIEEKLKQKQLEKLQKILKQKQIQIK